MARVFLSHANADAHLADEVAGWLTGHQVFLDQHPQAGLTVGDDWAARLHEQLRASDALVCLDTDAYRASHWCTAELAVATSRGMLVLPVRVSPGEHPLLGSTIQFTPSAGRRRAR